MLDKMLDWFAGALRISVITKILSLTYLTLATCVELLPLPRSDISYSNSIPSRSKNPFNVFLGSLISKSCFFSNKSFRFIPSSWASSPAKLKKNVYLVCEDKEVNFRPSSEVSFRIQILICSLMK